MFLAVQNPQKRPAIQNKHSTPESKPKIYWYPTALDQTAVCRTDNIHISTKRSKNADTRSQKLLPVHGSSRDEPHYIRPNSLT